MRAAWQSIVTVSAMLVAASTAAIDARMQATPAPAPAQAPKLPPGYVPRDSLPDSLALLPPPPATGSAAFARDEEISKAMVRAPGSPRWTQAASDADLHFPHIAQSFACAMGVTPDPAATPALYRLIGRMAIDVGLSTYKAKIHYQRVRPFVLHRNTSCYPPDEAGLRKDGSYPSGHSALGWGWALALAEIDPTRADAILQRGRDFGNSRLVCNVHWASDVDAGRVIASATVARLHAEPGFQADLAAAAAELAAAPRAPGPGCPAEAAALAQ